MTMGRLQSGFFGMTVRRAVYDYLRAVGLILFILLAVAWTIDLARHFPSLRAAAMSREDTLLGLLAPYLLHRGADIVARLLPMACLFGVLLAEIMRRRRLESVILEAAGFSTLRKLAALLWLALILGTLQGMLESRWRPAAVFAQIESGFGNYAGRYRREWQRTPVWFVGDARAVKAEVRRTDDPELRNLLIFEGIREPRLTRVLSAARGFPLQKPLHWRLEDIQIWNVDAEGSPPTAVASMEMQLDLIPEQISYYGIQEFNIPSPTLGALATRLDAPNAAAIQTAVWRRQTAWLLPGAFALLAAAMAQLVFEGRQLMVPRLIVLAGLGYVAVVSVKVMWALGELGTLPAPAAVLLPVLVAVLLAVGLSRRRI